nr:hypothetical protein [Lysobacter enzymogenes]
MHDQGVARVLQAPLGGLGDVLGRERELQAGAEFELVPALDPALPRPAARGRFAQRRSAVQAGALGLAGTRRN